MNKNLTKMEKNLTKMKKNCCHGNRIKISKKIRRIYMWITLCKRTLRLGCKKYSSYV